MKKGEKHVSKTVDAIKSFMNPFDVGDSKKAVKLTTTKNKVIEYRQQGNIFLQLFIRSQEGGKVEIEELMKFPLTPVPYSLATADDFFNKTDKSKGFHYLMKGVDNATLPSVDTTLIIEDGNAVFHYLTEVPGNFKQICYKVLDRLPKKTDVLFSTDMYYPDSIKSVERKRRGCAEKLLIQGELTKRPGDWPTFLTNDENKLQLIRLLEFGVRMKLLICIRTENLSLLQEGMHTALITSSNM